MSWFERHRQEWIGETLRVFGHINRRHIERKFSISVAQASLDLRTYQEEHPGAVVYDKREKRYNSTTYVEEDLLNIPPVPKP